MEANTTDIEREEAQLKSLLKDLQTRQRREERVSQVIDSLDTVFKEREIYYVQEHDKIYEYKRAWTDSPWAYYDQRAFRNEHPSIKDADGWATLMEWLRQKGCYFYKATYSFATQPNTVLNRMRTEHWIQPTDGEVNEWYDILMLALGGGTQQGKDHIEQLLVWKYKHPGDFLLPCVNWYDEGGVGKNLFVDGLLGAIFGKEQVSSVGLENLTGQFNSVIKGKTIILMNEAANRKVDMERFKNMIGQPDLYINEKKIPQYRVDNTALYFIATNDPMSIPVEGKKSDRRWSIIHLQRSIEVFVAERLNCSELDAKRLWENKFADQLKDPENLSVWLGHLFRKWADIERPEPLHGADYLRAVALRDELNPVKSALSYLESMDTWVPVLDLYLHAINAPTFDRSRMFSDYKRFNAEIYNEIKRRKLPLLFETGKKHWTRQTGVGDKKAANAAIIRYVEYSGPFTKNHHDYEKSDTNVHLAAVPQPQMQW